MSKTSENLYDIEFLRETEKEVDTLTINQQARLYREVKLLEVFGHKLREPHACHLRGKIYELRFRKDKLYFRVLYFSPGGDLFVLLHVFTKKTRKTPLAAIETAERRMSNYLDQSTKQERKRLINQYQVRVPLTVSPR